MARRVTEVVAMEIHLDHSTPVNIAHELRVSAFGHS